MSEAVSFFEGQRLRAKVYERERLKAKKTYRGAAIVTEYSATTVIPPGKRFRVDNVPNLLIDV